MHHSLIEVCCIHKERASAVALFRNAFDALEIERLAHRALKPRDFRKTHIVRHKEEWPASANQIFMRISIEVFAGEQIIGRTKKRKRSNQRARAHASDNIKDRHAVVTLDFTPTTQECRTKCAEIAATRNDEEINNAIIALAAQHAHDHGATSVLRVGLQLFDARIALSNENSISLYFASACATEATQSHADRSSRERAR